MKNIIRIACIIGIFVSLLASPIYADIYRAISDDGNIVNFSDAPIIYYYVVMGPFRKQGIAKNLQKWLKSNYNQESGILIDKDGGQNVSVAFDTQKEANSFGQKLVSDKIVGKYKVIKNNKSQLYMSGKPKASKPLFSD